MVEFLQLRLDCCILLPVARLAMGSKRKLWKGSWGGFDGGWVRGDGHGVICRTDRATPEGLGGTG